jgi:hypothetical protein
MKTAYFILGAESAGTRFVTDIFCSLGIYGDSSHGQRLDDLRFFELPDKIVFRRSCPHGDFWPDITGLIDRMFAAGYRVVPLLVVRNMIANIESQVRNGHAATHRIAHDTICHSTSVIYSDLANRALYPIVVHFELFTKSPQVRKALFDSLELEVPLETIFFDSFAKYRTDGVPIFLSHEWPSPRSI